MASKVDEQSKSQAGRLQVIHELRLVLGSELLDSLQFDDELPKTDKVWLIDLEQGLTLNLDRRIARSPSWTKSPAMFGNELGRLAPMLAENGLVVIFGRTRKARVIVLTTRPERHLAEATIETNIPGR